MIGYISADPGAKGYLCLLVPEINHIEWLSLDKNPIEIHKWLTTAHTQYEITKCMIEDVHSLHRMSAKSNFSFGFNVGMITGILKCFPSGLDKVAPKIWQKSIGIKPKDPNIKKSVGEKARELYPNCDIYGARGGLLDGKSDSLMIAHYCFEKYRGKNEY